MALPADRIQPVPFAEVGECVFCGERPGGYNPQLEDGPSVQIVSFDSSGGGDDEIPAGLIETIADGPARRTYRSKDSFGRGASTVVVEKAQVCSLCLKQGAALVGYGDLLPVTAELEDRDAELTTTRERLQEALRRAEEAEEAVRSMKVFERLFSAPEAPRKPAKKAA